jgi:hypothetical protein
MAHHVAIITPTQKAELVGHEWEPRSYFNPVQDCYNEWVISEEEVQELPLTDYCPPPSPPGPPTE